MAFTAAFTDQAFTQLINSTNSATRAVSGAGAFSAFVGLARSTGNNDLAYLTSEANRLGRAAFGTLHDPAVSEAIATGIHDRTITADDLELYSDGDALALLPNTANAGAMGAIKQHYALYNSYTARLGNSYNVGSAGSFQSTAFGAGDVYSDEEEYDYDIDSYAGDTGLAGSVDSSEVDYGIDNGAASATSPEYESTASVQRNNQSFLYNKQPFLFVVDIEFSQAMLSQLATKLRQNFSFVAREVSRPKFSVEYEEINQYNFRTRVPKRTTYDPVTVTAVDDEDNTTMRTALALIKAISPVSNVPDLFPIGTDSTGMVGVDVGQATYGTRAQSINLSSLGTVQNASQRITPTDGISDLVAPISKLVVHHVFRYGAATNIYTYRNVRVTSISMSSLNMATSDAPEVTFEFNYDSLVISEEYAMDHAAIIQSASGDGLGGMVAIDDPSYTPVEQGVVAATGTTAGTTTGGTTTGNVYDDDGVLLEPSTNDVTGDAFDIGDSDTIDITQGDTSMYSDIDGMTSYTNDNDIELAVTDTNIGTVDSPTSVNLNSTNSIVDLRGQTGTTPTSVDVTALTTILPNAITSTDLDGNGTTDILLSANLDEYNNTLVTYPTATTDNLPSYPTTTTFNQVMTAVRDVSQGLRVVGSLNLLGVQDIVSVAQPIVALTGRTIAAISPVITQSTNRIESAVASGGSNPAAIGGLISGAVNTQREITNAINTLNRLF